jgi:hypothetical protein
VEGHERSLNKLFVKECNNSAFEANIIRIMKSEMVK